MLSFTAGIASAQNTPKFEDYSVSKIFEGKPASIDLSSHPMAPTFQSMLLASVSEGVNFAGHYSVAEWGCGTGCIHFAFVDCETGKVFFPTFQSHYPSIPEEPSFMDRYKMIYHKDSRLLIINGLPGNKTKLGSYYYEFTNENLELIDFTEWDCLWNKKQFTQPVNAGHQGGAALAD